MGEVYEKLLKCYECYQSRIDCKNGRCESGTALFGN